MADEEEKELEENEDGNEPEDEEEGDEDGDGKKKKKKKGGKLKYIILGIILLFSVAGGAIAYIMGVFEKEENPAVRVVESESEEKNTEPNADGVIEQAVFYDMEEFVVNLNVGNKRPSFLKITVSLELSGESQVPRIEERMPKIRDSFQIYLRELRQEDLRGSAGLYRLREELLLRINKVVYPAKVNDILFKEILVQ